MDKSSERIWKIAMDALQEYFPPETLQGDFFFFEAMKDGNIAKLAIDELLGNTSEAQFSWQTEMQAVLHKALVSIEGSLRWCLENPEERGEKVYVAMAELKHRLQIVSKEVNRPDVVRWTEDFGRMKVGLLELAEEGVSGCVHNARSTESKGLEQFYLDVGTVLRTRAKQIRARLNTSTKHYSKEESTSTSEALKKELRRKGGELDDLKVRMKVFEDRIARATKERRELVECKERVAELEQMLLQAQSPNSSKSEEPTNLEGNLTKGSTPKRFADVGSSYDKIAVVNEAERLRGVIMRAQVADLRPTISNNDGVTADGEITAIRKEYQEISEAWNESRRIASKFAAVKLDPETLKPLPVTYPSVRKATTNRFSSSTASGDRRVYRPIQGRCHKIPLRDASEAVAKIFSVMSNPLYR